MYKDIFEKLEAFVDIKQFSKQLIKTRNYIRKLRHTIETYVHKRNKKKSWMKISLTFTEKHAGSVLFKLFTIYLKPMVQTRANIIKVLFMNRQ